VSVTARQLVGRDEELTALVHLLDAREQLPSVAVLAGEAGIGKTTLWLAGLDAAAARGYRTLSCRPSEAETASSFIGLTDLLDNAAAGLLPELPPIQRRALEAALLLGESESYVDDRAVAAAFLGALRLLAADGPLCVAVDDVQWLDAASLSALRFVLARLEQEPIAALLAVRGHVPAWARRAVPEERMRTVDVGSLSVGAIHELLRTRLGMTLPRPLLIRISETSRGNPFFALELARALQRRGGTLAVGEELPVPSDLEGLLFARIDGLSAAALEVARVVAALAEPTVTLAEAALGAHFEPGMADALRAHILELDRERLRFTHPLLASAVAARATPARRRSLHARLADVVPSSEERAHHLALATLEPDSEVAAILEVAARTALARGAPTAAAELAEQALQLTPHSSPDDAHRRLLLAADMQGRAGDIGQATALLERARAVAAPGPERATALADLARLQVSQQRAAALLRDALSEAEGYDALQARIHSALARVMDVSVGTERGIEHGELAVHAASRAGGAALRCRALATYGLVHFRGGRGVPSEMEEALTLERSLAEWPLDAGPAWTWAHQLYWSGDVERARELFQELLSAVGVRNDPRREADALWFLSHVEWRAGNWEVAARYASDSLDLLSQIGRLAPELRFPAAVIAAHQGRIDDARANAEQAGAGAEVEGSGLDRSLYAGLLGFIELSAGDASAALPHLRSAYELRNVFMLEPGMRLELADLLEALIAVGELSEADEVLTTWQERADTLDRAWALAILARGRGLLLAARGDLEGALASLDRALAEHARSTDPFQHARTLLALGRTQRRAKRRGVARTNLEEALAAFERLGAPLWAEQARAELARIGGRPPSRGELTAAERRIAALVAEGRTNREVAAALFLAERTVEAHLSHVYAKLGVRSRTELAHRLSPKS
jgi:DNA-binding CsgD family transcriptional regulator